MNRTLNVIRGQGWKNEYDDFVEGGKGKSGKILEHTVEDMRYGNGDFLIGYAVRTIEEDNDGNIQENYYTFQVPGYLVYVYSGVVQILEDDLANGPAGCVSGIAGRTGKVVAKVVANNLTKSQLKSIAALEKQIIAHEEKLAEYIKNPYKFDNKGFLKNAPNDEVRKKIIESRIKHLLQEIQTFKSNIQKIIDKK